MIIKKLSKPTSTTPRDYDRQLWDELERFSYDVILNSRFPTPLISGGVITGDITLGDENLVFIDATSADVTVTLPALAKSIGRAYWIKRIDSSSNTVTVDGDGSETIDGETTQILFEYDCMAISPSGTEWSII
jgi:hypothetical protein